MIGFPLRLLARENYDKVIKQKGVSQVALVTGEEKIIPQNPRYWICTVEAMPLDVSVSFLAIDEIQLCADPERGYVFTDRLLNARGTMETCLWGRTPWPASFGSCCLIVKSKHAPDSPSSTMSRPSDCKRSRVGVPSWCFRPRTCTTSQKI